MEIQRFSGTVAEHATKAVKSRFFVQRCSMFYVPIGGCRSTPKKLKIPLSEIHFLKV